MYFDIHSHSFKPNSTSVFNAQLGVDKWNFTSKYYSIGLHPWWIQDWKEQFEVVKMNSEKAILIGEAGLDRLIPTDLKLQQEIFEKHIQLSEELKKPLIIHCVKSFSELVSIKKNLEPTQPWILHGFNHRASILESLIQNQIYISFGAALLNPKSKASELISQIPNHHLLLETDDSHYSIEHIYESAATLKGISLKKLKELIQSNIYDLGIQLL